MTNELSDVRSIEDILPLSPMQQGMLFHSLLDEKSGIYFEQLSTKIEGEFDIRAFQKAWQEVINRNSMLRTSFVWEDVDEPLQVIHKKVEAPFIIEDWSQLSEEEQERKFDLLLEQDRVNLFDISRAPLMRFGVIKLKPKSHRFIWSNHHLLFDGWSFPIILKEVFTFYEGFRNGYSPYVQATRPYRDFIAWLQHRSETEAETFWKNYLHGVTSQTPLTIDSLPKPATELENEHPLLQRKLSSDVSLQLRLFSQQHGITLSSIIQGALALLMHMYSGENDIVFGVTVSGRPPELVGSEKMIGLFINTLPVRTQYQSDMILLEWLRHLQVQSVNIRKFEHTPLAQIQKWSEIDEGAPLFNAILVFENYPVDEVLQKQGGGLQLSDIRHSASTNYPITVIVAPGQDIEVHISYIPKVVDVESVSRMLEHLCLILEQIPEYYERPLESITLLSEKDQLLIESWSSPQKAYSGSAFIHELIAEQAKDYPLTPALIYGDQTITYAELNKKANKLARYLQSRGIKPEKRVGLCLNRSPELFTSLLAILKAGGAYVPIDVKLPLERKKFVIEDSGVELIISHSELASQLSHFSGEILSIDCRWEEIDEYPDMDFDSQVSLENMMYIIYTSGTTGKPKGVIVEHKALINHARVMSEEFKVVPGKRILSFISMSFDAAGEEIFPLLMRGGTLVLSPSDLEYSGEKILNFCRQNLVEILHLPSAVWHRIVADIEVEKLRVPASLRILLVGGESSSPDHLRTWTQALDASCQFINAYGPTEATISSSYFSIPCEKEIVDSLTSLPIGKPIPNAEVFVLDKNKNIAPIGLPGELFIGGSGLARGYHNLPALTQEKFIHWNSRTLYSTGDRVAWLPDGNLYFLGRNDEQIKWRGYRIEPNEIQTILRQIPEITEAIVILREDHPGDKRLTAYYVASTGKELPVSDVRSFVADRLPEYMVPSFFTQMEAFPYTPTGKVNRKALPIPLTGRTETGGYLPPRNPTEEILVGLFCDVLKLEQVGVFDNFFSLGGHSLLATQLVSRIRSVFTVEFPVRLLFENPTIAEMADRIYILENNHGLPPAPEVVPVDRSGPLPVSFSQQRLWFLDQLEPGNLFYNIPIAVRLVGNLDINLLSRSLNEIINRHEVLRTRFGNENGVPVQIIDESFQLDIHFTDLSEVSNDERQKQTEILLQEDAQKSFNLATGPIIRAALLKIDENEHIALLVIHHIAADGLSMMILIQELAALYNEFMDGTGAGLNPLPIQYADYAAWQRNWLKAEVLDEQLNYWKTQLSGSPPLLELPTDRPRPAVKTFTGSSMAFQLPEALADNIKGLCQENGITPYMFLLAAFQTLLFRYSNEEDILIGTAIANRSRAEIEPLIGFFVNTLVMRSDLSGNPSFIELLSRVREVTLGAYAHPDLPFEMLVDALQPNRNLSYTPIFQIGFDVQTIHVDHIELPGLKIEPVIFDSKRAAYDLLLSITLAETSILGTLEYNSDLFNLATIEKMIGNFKILLSGIVDDPDSPIFFLPLLSQEEKKLVTVDWNRTEIDMEYDQCIQERFERRVDANPQNLALRFLNQSMSYWELNQKANQLAGHLREQGTRPDTVVGILLERSFEMVIGILGVLKAGSAYLPLDPNYPPDRLSFMMEDASKLDTSNPLLIITQEALINRIPDGNYQVMCIDRDWSRLAHQPSTNLPVIISPENLAYVIYTSGSTGTPKGTLLSHRGLCNLNEVQKRTFKIGPESKILQFSALSFDASVWEIFMALGNGGTLVLAPQDVLSSGLDLLRILREEAVTTVTLPPSLLSVLPEESLPDLRTIIAAGEACASEIVNRWAKGRIFFNAYGPTETTVCASMAQCHENDPLPPSIGRPLPNFQLYVVDKFIQPLPVGVPGELMVGGVGLAQGYLHRPDITAEKFIPNPFKPGKKLYRTGDLVRYRTDGNLEFLGRIDQQVKVRGFRIELGEIESVLRQVPEVGDAAVMVREDHPGDKRLVAYIVPNDSQTLSELEEKISEIKDILRVKLPVYMIPSHIVPLAEFPLSPSGKVNRKALVAPSGLDQDLESTYVPPNTLVERQLVEICSSLLGLEKVGIHHNFFEIGGHSLLATQFISRVRETCGVELSLRSLFEHPTVFEIAIEIETLKIMTPESPIPAIHSVSREGRRMKLSDLNKQ
jgi:amino acid adenylation domain-containing protein